MWWIMHYVWMWWWRIGIHEVWWWHGRHHGMRRMMLWMVHQLHGWWWMWISSPPWHSWMEMRRRRWWSIGIVHHVWRRRWTTVGIVDHLMRWWQIGRRNSLRLWLVRLRRHRMVAAAAVRLPSCRCGYWGSSIIRTTTAILHFRVRGRWWRCW